MSLLPILVAAAVLGGAVIAGVAVARAVSRRSVLHDLHGLALQRAGLLSGAALAGAAWFAGDHHELMLALAPLAGSGWVLALVVAERERQRQPLGPLRVAGLGPRTAGGIVSRHALNAMRATFAITAGLAVLAIVLASSGDARSYAQACADGTVTTVGVWPGAPYAVPAIVGLVLGWVVVEWAIRCVVRRPPGTGREREDSARRTLAARTAVTAAMLMALPTLALLLLSMGARIHAACPTGGENTVALGMLAAGGLLALASAAGWMAALLSGGRSVVTRVPA